MDYPQGSYRVGLTVSLRKSGDVDIIDATGRVTLGDETNTLREALQTLIVNNRRKILLNLAGVSYVDSSGIRELAAALNALKGTGGRLKLLNPNKRVQDLLQITKLYTVFDVQQDEATAVGSFG